MARHQNRFAITPQGVDNRQATRAVDGVAFMLLLIFVFVFNIIFWWIFFFKICFPVPKKLAQG